MFECLAGYLLLIKLSRLTDACLYLFLSLSLSRVKVAVASFFVFAILLLAEANLEV